VNCQRATDSDMRRPAFVVQTRWFVAVTAIDEQERQWCRQVSGHGGGLADVAGCLDVGPGPPALPAVCATGRGADLAAGRGALPCAGAQHGAPRWRRAGALRTGRGARRCVRQVPGLPPRLAGPMGSGRGPRRLAGRAVAATARGAAHAPPRAARWRRAGPVPPPCASLRGRRATGPPGRGARARRGRGRGRPTSAAAPGPPRGGGGRSRRGRWRPPRETVS